MYRMTVWFYFEAGHSRSVTETAVGLINRLSHAEKEQQLSPAGSASRTKIYKNILKKRDKINKGKKNRRKKRMAGKK